MTTMNLIQLAIFMTGVIAVFLTQQSDSKLRRYACLFGLAGQPFWVYTAVEHQQWGIALACVVYSYSWGIGFYNNWIAEPKRPTSELRMALDITGVEPINSLLKMLQRYQGELPEDLRFQIENTLVADRSRVAWNIDYFEGIGISRTKVKVVLDGEPSEHVIEIYPHSCEAMISGKGVRQFQSIKVFHRDTDELICEASNAND